MPDRVKCTLKFANNLIDGKRIKYPHRAEQATLLKMHVHVFSSFSNGG